MNSSRFLRYWACVVGVLVTATFAFAGKPAPPPSLVATTTDGNFLETVVGKVSCQAEFNLAIIVSGKGTHYRYKMGPSGSTNPGVLTGYSAPIPKATPLAFNVSGQAVGGYVLCLQGLELAANETIKSSQPLNQATAYYWTKDTPPVQFHVTFTGKLPDQPADAPTQIWAINNSSTGVGRCYVSDGTAYHAIRWTLLSGLEDISSLAAPWYDLELDTFVDGWILRNASDINEAGQIAGTGFDGVTKRAVVYDPLTGFTLLPRLHESPYDQAVGYWLKSINENGEVQGQIDIPNYPTKTYLWTPANPTTIHVIDPAATSPILPGGIGTNTFMTNTIGLDGGVFSLDTFAFVNGVLEYDLLDTVSVYPGGESGANTFINGNGAFGYCTSGATTQYFKLYQPGQGSLTARVSTDASRDYADLGFRINNSNDFVYNEDDIPYLYRYGENRSYRLYDLADSYTKSTLFAPRDGLLRNSTRGIVHAVVSGDDAADAPEGNPFDTIGGYVEYDLTTGAEEGFVLTPVPRQ